MDRLVKADVKELKLTFTRGQNCTASFKLTNLMHTMSVAISLSTSNSTFAFSTSSALLPPLSTSAFTLRLSRPSDLPPFSSPPSTVTVRSATVPTGKASPDDLRRLFSRPGSHIFRDATIPISLVGPHVVESLFSASTGKETASLLSRALSGCHVADLDSLLRVAAKGGHSYFVASLIDAGADPNDRTEGRSDGLDQPSVLSLAIQSGDSESVRTLIESGFSPDPSDRLIHDAAENDRVDLLSLLCSKYEKIDFNSTDSLGRTALHIAAVKGNCETIRFLIKSGCDPDIEDSKGWTPLHYAASEGYIDTAELLLNSCIYAKDVVSKDGDTPFTLAVEKGYTQLHNSLHLGEVLHRAARVGDVREIRRCLANGAKVNSKDQNGWTPLHRAAFKGRIECVKVLLGKGADVDVVENSGRTALQLASEAGHLQVVLCLKGYGGKVFKGFEMDRFGLDCFKNHPSLVTTLCQNKESA